MSEDVDTGGPVLRIAGPDDAIALMKLKQRLDEETSFMLLEPGERDTSIQALARHLEEVSQSENSVVIVAGATIWPDTWSWPEGGSGGTGPPLTSSSVSWLKRAVKASAPDCWRRQSAGRLPAACVGSSST